MLHAALLPLVVLCHSFSWRTTNAQCPCNTSANFALLSTFRDTTGGDAWSSVTWTGADICAWKGVSCVGVDVTSISLPSNNLRGTLPGAVLGQLVALQAFMVPRNSLHGSLPEELALLKNMITFDASSNSLSGTLLDLLGAAWEASIQTLNMSTNSLGGTLPRTTVRGDLLRRST